MNIKKVILQDIKYSILKNKIPIKYINDIQLTEKTKIGHYQINGIIKITNKLKINTLQFSKKIIFYFRNNHQYSKIKNSPEGFINIFLNKYWLSNQLENIIYIKNFKKNNKNPKNIVIDYSSPNMAKEMHVGHLRSTILGDTMSKIMKLYGHNVIKINHIGDWGEQFGMLIAFIKINNYHYTQNALSLKKLEIIYQKSKKLYETSNQFKQQAQKYLIKLYDHDQECRLIWKKIIQITLNENNKIYKKLQIKLKNKHILGESFYVNMLPKIIIDLKNKKIVKKYQDNLIIYLNQFKNKNNQPMGVIIQKNNSSFLYSSIDLACLKYRIEYFKADKIIYYTDIRQNQHLNQVWLIAKQAKYLPKKIILEHHSFGMVLNNEKKPFKTRDGKLIKLNELILESIKRAKKIIKLKKPNYRNKKLLNLSKIIGISSIKYFDLSKNRNTNYVFNWDQMLSFHGNTALYIQYTYTRIQSIIKKSKIKINKIKTLIILNKEIEIKISIKLLQFQEIINDIKKYGTPHLLCFYLFELSSLFSIFYEQYSIIYSKEMNIKYSRLKLSFIISKIIKQGLKLLGIKTVKKI